MPSDKERILCLLREHHMKVRPNAKILVPETVKRNLKNKKEEESYLLYLIPYLILV